MKRITMLEQAEWIKLYFVAIVSIFISKVYGEVEHRRYGPFEKLPLIQHAHQVALIAASAGCSVEVIVASLLHDAFEGYHHEDPSVLEPKIEGKLREMFHQAVIEHELHFGAKLFDDVEAAARNFSSTVLRLVWAVTEPPKTATPENYQVRKQKYLANIRAEDLLAAEVSIVAKISGLLTALKFFREDSLGWSRGTPEENYQLFAALLEAYEEKGVSIALLMHYKVLLEKFRKEGERVTALHREREHQGAA